MNTRKYPLLYISIITIIVVEIYCAVISYYNYNAIEPFFISILIFLNVVPLTLLFYKKIKVSMLLFLLIAAIIIPDQIAMRIKYFENKTEGENIVDYIYKFNKRHKEFPKNLASYKFKNKELEKEFIYIKDNESDFVLLFSVGTKSTSHYYRHSRTNSIDRKWNYCDD